MSATSAGHVLALTPPPLPNLQVSRMLQRLQSAMWRKAEVRMPPSQPYKTAVEALETQVRDAWEDMLQLGDKITQLRGEVRSETDKYNAKCQVRISLYRRAPSALPLLDAGPYGLRRLTGTRCEG
jgi:hypothetical protein